MTEHLLDAKGVLARANDEQQSSNLQNRIIELSSQPPSLRKRKP